MKICTKCDQAKDESEFCKDKAQKDGLCTQCKMCRIAYQAIYKVTHHEAITKRQAAYDLRRREKQLTRLHEHYAAHREEEHIRKQVYYIAHREEIQARGRIHDRARRAEKTIYHRVVWLARPQNRIANCLRSRLAQALKGKAKRGSAIRDLGCGIEDFMQYIECQFTEGMTWANYGTVWELDHIRPLSSFDLTDHQQLREAVHYTNIQPLTIEQNRSKGASTSVTQAPAIQGADI